MTRLRSLALLATGIALGGAAATAQDDASVAAYSKVHSDMMATMKDFKPSPDADKTFLEMMIPHHQGGVDTAEVELRYGTNEKVKALAAKISENQKKEIAEMEKLLEDM